METRGIYLFFYRCLLGINRLSVIVEDQIRKFAAGKNKSLRDFSICINTCFKVPQTSIVMEFQNPESV